MTAAPRVAQLWIPGRLASMNDLMLEKAQRFGKKKNACAAIVLLAKQARLPRFEAAHVRFELVEPNRKRDPDGACAGAAKVILDALQHAGVLDNDGWKSVLSLSYRWRCDPKEPGVRVTLVSGV